MAKTKKTIPVKKNELLEVEIENLASSGDGVCHREGYTLFFPRSVKGDRLKARVVRLTPRFGVCRQEELLEPSSCRCEPFCEHYELCGGCQLQHLSYEQQMEFKVGVLEDALRHVGGIEKFPSPRGVPSLPPHSYRNKAIFALEDKGGEKKIGFYERGTHQVVDIRSCPVTLPAIDSIKEAVRKVLRNSPLAIYDEDKNRGFLRKLVVRGGETEKEYLVGLVTTSGEVPPSVVESLATINETLGDGARIVGVVQNINIRVTNAIFGKENRLLWGRDYYYDSIGKVRYRLSLTSFFQAHPRQMSYLNETVDRMAGEHSGERLLDAYSGIGSIALWLAAARGWKVVGVEDHEKAVEDAGRTAEENGIDGVEFIHSPVEKFITGREGGGFPIVIVDPPRKGCDPRVIGALLEKKPRRIIYVSCKPSTLARDLKELTAGGYRIAEMEVIDMFPQTVHLETVVRLEREATDSVDNFH